MPIDALLISEDAAAVRVLRRVLEDIGITTTEVPSATRALDELALRKYDAVIIDCDDVESGKDVIMSVRRGTSNRSAILFAITNGKTDVRAAFDLGANFVLDKPISPDRATRSVRAAHGLIVRERRRYLRQPVEVPVILTLENGTSTTVTAQNVSEGGMAIKADRPLQQGTSVRASFRLPDTKRVLEARCEIAWTGVQNRAGLRFVFIAEDVRRDLLSWLEREFERAMSEPLLMNLGGGWTK